MNPVLSPSVDQSLSAITLALIERLLMSIDEDAITSATLTERLSALDVLSRLTSILSQFETTRSENSTVEQQPEKEIVRVEQQDSQARRGESPPRTGANPEHARPLPGGCVWATLRQD